ncbi:MAG TPA: PPC domain-containing protein [Polyangiaceae bacterium]|jgi:hypothetical protein|nr:PPC domain-containing protein [Polyangiaceae bacterium]
MKTTLIGHLGISFIALVIAGGCKVTTTTDEDDGGPQHGTGASSGDDGSAGDSEASGGSGGASASGGASGAGGAHAGGTTGTGAESGDSGLDSGSPGGSSTDAGPGSGTDAGPGDPCGSDETKPNDDREHPTPYTLGTDFHGCLQNGTDVDFYSFTAPTTPAQGGYFIISATEVGSDGSVMLTSQAVADNGEISSPYGGLGASVFAWYNAKAGASFRVKVSYFSAPDKPTPYTLKVVYHGVNDVNEPNDTRATATPMTAGTPIHGYEFAGFENSSAPITSSWEDWFKVTLPAGSATITLSDLASDVNGYVTLYDANGVSLSSAYEGDQGASVVVTQTVTAGTYYVKINPFDLPYSQGNTSTVPAYLSQPYTLTASVQ